ncbi:cell growth regulator with RING finger domain protein 1-like [Amphiura filiformis]|uniref:cell growth regulator with RING finger domain protein 1-like n=1 Tax=Amphiura filiformis TaxID=82378 RepID=UPI003B21AF82
MTADAAPEFDIGIGLVIALLLILALVIFVTQWEPVFSPYKTSVDDVPEVPMMGIQLPFTLQIKEAENASFTSGMRIQLKTEHTCMLQVFWGVHCATLQQALQGNPLQLVQQANVLLQGKCIAENDSLWFEEGSDEELLVRPPVDADQLNLGPPPRTQYPLCLIIKSRESLLTQNQPAVIGSIMIIHIPDTILREKCHIISHILVTNKGHAHDLQTMYMAADSNDPSPETPSAEESTPANLTNRFSSDAEEVPRDCTVCQNAPISRVILPCRHACICTSCFPLVTRCPMCRGVIHSFFSLSTDSLYQHGSLNRTDDEEKGWMGKIEDSCERLNQWLGI